MSAVYNRHGEHQVCVRSRQGHDLAAESEGVQSRLVTTSIRPPAHVSSSAHCIICRTQCDCSPSRSTAHQTDSTLTFYDLRT